MPQIIVCGGCNRVLYKGLELKPANEIMQQLGGNCPACGKKLNFSPQDVTITPSIQTNPNVT